MSLPKTVLEGWVERTMRIDSNSLLNVTADLGADFNKSRKGSILKVVLTRTELCHEYFLFLTADRPSRKLPNCISELYCNRRGHAVAYLVEALCYTLEGCGFDFRTGHSIFQLAWSFQPHYGPGVDSASNRNEYQESPWGVKGGRRVMLTSVSRLSRENEIASTSHNPVGLRDLLQWYLYFYLSLL
jgi:hypothetical protein